MALKSLGPLGIDSGNPLNTRGGGAGMLIDEYANNSYVSGLGNMLPSALDSALSADANLRIAQMNNATQLAQTQMNLPTAAQLALAYRGFQPANQFYKQTMQDGGYSDAARQSILSAAYGNINNSAKAMQQNLQAGLASRGLGANPYASQALGMQGMFAASGARGQALAGLEQNAIQNRMGAAQGMSGNAAAQGALAMKPLQDPGAMSGFDDSGYAAGRSGGRIGGGWRLPREGGGSSPGNPYATGTNMGTGSSSAGSSGRRRRPSYETWG